MPSYAHQPVTGPHVWTAQDYANRDDWKHVLSDDALKDIDKAMRAVKQKGLTLDQVGPSDFDLPALAGDLKQIKDILSHDRGFVLIKGIDLDKYDEAEAGIITYGIASHFGTIVSQSHRGDRLGRVIDEGGVGRYYTVGGPIEFHMDPVDITGLMCVRPAIKGGESWIASSYAIHNTILAERPDLIDTLYAGYYYSQQPTVMGGDTPYTNFRIPVFDETEGNPACFYLPLSIRMAAKRAEHGLSDKEQEAFDFLDSVAMRPDMNFQMDFQPGDIQFLNNRNILHARGDYQDADEMERRRLLYRIWLMIPDWPAPPEAVQKRAVNSDRAGGGIKKGAVPITA